jgi:hypothetical protein|tara:strand:- start:610 stop:969 length:360 start_codon:yes stop_codon:yes gene_type:complete
MMRTEERTTMKRLTPEVGLYANLAMYSDAFPFEIVKIVSAKTIEIRSMEATLDPSWKPEMIPGGFCAHTTNQDSQRWTYESKPTAHVFRARRRKDGYFHSKQGRHLISDHPVRFHDYNF